VLILLLLFFSRETADDERVQEVKLKALSVGFFSGWGGGRRAVFGLSSGPARRATNDVRL
jgi:hypothetical protein